MARKAGSLTQAKAESITVRLDPKIRYGLELMARKQRRTLSSVVEWALLQAMESREGGLIEDAKDGGQPINHMAALWDTEESDRLFHMAVFKPEWLTFEEEKLFKIIRESDYYQATVQNNEHLIEDKSVFSVPFHQKLRESLREHFETFKKVANGELGKDALPKPPRFTKKQIGKVQGVQ